MVSFLPPCVHQLASNVLRLDLSPSISLGPQGQPTPTSVITALDHQRQCPPLVHAAARLLPTTSADTTKATEVNQEVQLLWVACQSISPRAPAHWAVDVPLMRSGVRRSLVFLFFGVCGHCGADLFVWSVLLRACPGMKDLCASCKLPKNLGGGPSI